MNKVILSGNLCKEIDLRYTQNNVAVIQNTIAVKNDYKNKDGEYDSQFINLVVWRQAAEFLSKYAAKGSKILVEGQIRNRTYEKQDGTKGYVTEVVAEKVELLNSPVKNNEQKPVEKQEEKRPTLSDDPFKEFGEQKEINTDDLPF